MDKELFAAVNGQENPRDNGSVQVIVRAVNILRTLKGHPKGLSLSQIAKEVGLARSTVHRIVSTLEAEQFVVPVSANGRIRLGPALAALGASVNNDLRHQIRPYLDRLFLEVNETVDLAVLDMDQLVFVDQIAAPHRLQAVSGIGVTFPLHCTANGKAMLAELAPDHLARILPDPLPALTPQTMTTRAQLLEELARVKVERVAFDREEHTLGICAVGAVIRDPLGTLAAVSIPAPSIRFYGNEQTLTSALLNTCDLIQHHLESF